MLSSFEPSNPQSRMNFSVSCLYYACTSGTAGHSTAKSRTIRACLPFLSRMSHSGCSFATFERRYLCDSYFPCPSSTPSGNHQSCTNSPCLWNSSVIFLIESPGKVSGRGSQSPYVSNQRSSNVAHLIPSSFSLGTVPNICAGVTLNSYPQPHQLTLYASPEGLGISHPSFCNTRDHRCSGS